MSEHTPLRNTPWEAEEQLVHRLAERVDNRGTLTLLHRNKGLNGKLAVPGLDDELALFVKHRDLASGLPRGLRDGTWRWEVQGVNLEVVSRDLSSYLGPMREVLRTYYYARMELAGFGRSSPEREEAAALFRAEVKRLMEAVQLRRGYMPDASGRLVPPKSGSRGGRHRATSRPNKAARRQQRRRSRRRKLK